MTRTRTLRKRSSDDDEQQTVMGELVGYLAQQGARMKAPLLLRDGGETSAKLQAEIQNRFPRAVTEFAEQGGREMHVKHIPAWPKC